MQSYVIDSHSRNSEAGERKTDKRCKSSKTQRKEKTEVKEKEETAKTK